MTLIEKLLVLCLLILVIGLLGLGILLARLEARVVAMETNEAQRHATVATAAAPSAAPSRELPAPVASPAPVSQPPLAAVAAKPAPTPTPAVAPVATPVPAPTPAPAAAPVASGKSGGGAILATQFGDLAILPPDNAWNQDISKLPVHPRSQAYIRNANGSKGLHPDFGTVWNNAPMGIPFVVVRGTQPKVTLESWAWPDECDKVAYPIPANVPIEGGPGASADSDRHALILDYDNKVLYELYQLTKTATGWKASSGAVWDLSNNKSRPAGWTSADAAGLPIFPGLARYDEVVLRHELKHALRFTVQRSQHGYIHPATHYASRITDPDVMPMGLRLRLKADYDISSYPASAQVILRGLKTYGMIMADNGSDWFISGAPDPRWSDDELNTLKKVHGTDFEVVDTGPVITDASKDR